MKKIIFFVLLLSLVSEGSKAQQSGDIRLIPRQTPMVGSDSVIGTHNRTTKNFRESDFPIAGDITGTLGASIVGKILGRTISSTAPTTGQVYQWNGTNWAPATISGGGGSVVDAINDGVTSSSPSQNAVFDALAGKQTSLVSGTNIKTINGNSILGSGDLAIAGGSGGSSYKPYTNTTYASSINLNYDATSYLNVTGITGNLTFTASNNTNGKPFVVTLKKTGSGASSIFFDASTFGTPRMKSYTSLVKGVQSSSPYYFTLPAGAGEYVLVFDTYIDGTRIFIDNDANLDNAIVQKANNLNLRNFPVIADPGNTTAETVLYTHYIAPGTLSDTSSLVIPYIYRRSGSGTFQIKIRACASANQTLSTCPTIEDYGDNSTNGDLQRTAVMTNVNLSSQRVQPGYNNPQNLAAAITRSIDFSQPVWLKFTGEKQSSGSQVGGFGGIRINGEGL